MAKIDKIRNHPKSKIIPIGENKRIWIEDNGIIIEDFFYPKPRRISISDDTAIKLTIELIRLYKEKR